MRFVSSFQALASGFGHDRRANVAVMFALALLPLVGVAGAAVDYSRASSKSSSMQAAADATALAISKEAATLSSAALQTKAQAVFSSIFNQRGVNDLTVAATYTQTPSSKVVVNVSGTVPTGFMNIVGKTNMPVSTVSQATWGNTKLRVALVLDTTGSMGSSGKMAAMQTAAKNLLTQFQAAATQDGDVLVSIIPFSKDINVGASNYGATWIDWTDWEAQPAIMSSWTAANPGAWEAAGPGTGCPFPSYGSPGFLGFVCVSGPGSTTSAVTVPSTGYICPSVDAGTTDATKAGVMYNGCYNSTAGTRTIDTGSQATCGTTANCTCSGNGSHKQCVQTYYTHSWVKNARSTWNGCITDRGASTGPSSDYDRGVATPVTGVAASLFPAEQNATCSPQVTSLGYNWTAMKASIDAFYSLGSTNQPIGLVSGWQSLVGGGPFSTPPAKDSRFQYKEVVILMSDGLNTVDRWYTTSTSVDRRMYDTSALGTCPNLKAAGITVYTVQVNTSSDPTSTLLQNCATTSDKFWMVTSSGALNDVFNQIGTELSTLRISN